MKILCLLCVVCFLHIDANAQQKEHLYNLLPVTDSKQATFPGGQQGWMRYLEHSLNYPEKAMEDGIQGTVKVQITVLSDGAVTDVKALNNPGGGLAKEAERIFKTSPKWIPAEQNGQKIVSHIVKEISFKMM